MSRAPRSTVAAAALVAMVVGLGSSACSVPRGGLTGVGDAGGCEAVLPLARNVVGGAGALVEVRRVNRTQIDTISRQAGVAPLPSTSPRRTPVSPPSSQPPGQPKTCLVVYHGTYPPGAIPGATPPATSGSYALIVLRVRHPSVVRVLVTNDIPPAAKP